MLKSLALALALLGLPAVASAQVVVPAHCPPGFVHEGAYCVGEGERYPFADFLRGGRFFGRPFHRRFGRPGFGGMGRPGFGHGPVYRPPSRPGAGHGRPGRP